MKFSEFKKLGPYNVSMKLGDKYIISQKLQDEQIKKLELGEVSKCFCMKLVKNDLQGEIPGMHFDVVEERIEFDSAGENNG